jgi:hypothetical protein
MPLFELWPKQREAMRLLGLDEENPVDEPVQELLFGGQAGGGKSLWIRALACFLGLEYWPGSRGVIFRNTFPQLYGTHILPMLQEIPGLGSGAFGRYNATSHDITWPNGSILHFRHCDADADTFNYLSEEWDFALFDEATQLTELQYTLLRTRVRSSRPGWRRLIVACSNPGGPSHGYFKTRFVDAAPAGVPFMGSDGWARAFLPSTLRDNPALSEADYRKTLEAISDPVLRKAYATGDWNISADQAFTEWDPGLHVVEPFEVPHDWARFGGHDYGYSAPACHLWLAKVPPRVEIPVKSPALRVSDRARVVVYRELYQAGLVAQLQALRIRNASHGERRGPIFADPSMFGRSRELGASFAEEFAAAGVPLARGNNNRMKGIERVHRALMGHDLWPPELIVMSNCWNLIRTLPNLPRDKHNPEDVMTEAEDHAYDALRYALMGTSTRARADERSYSLSVR